MAVMEILPGVHEVHLNGSKGHVIIGEGPDGRPAERLTMIDAGLPGSRSRLEPQLAAIGRTAADIGRIVATHGHPDHAGGIPELADETTEIMMHPADIAGCQATWRDFLRKPSRSTFFASMTPPPPPHVTPIEDGAVIPVLGGATVIHTPGHTPGSICLWIPELRAVFTGDTLEVRGRRLSFASPLYSDDHAVARRSVARIAALDVETIVFSHFRPWRENAREALESLAARV
jgi:glyoxylase-like metal-dependent hydrolase (beta-lactamase superfamily II)